MPEFILDHGTRDIEKIEAALGENLVWLADALDLRIRQGDKETIARLAQLNAAWILAVKLAEAAVDAVAAPGLYEALSNALRQLEAAHRQLGMRPEDNQRIGKGKSALARARGEKP